jgi:hypothetical protein
MALLTPRAEVGDKKKRKENGCSKGGVPPVAPGADGWVTHRGYSGVAWCSEMIGEGQASARAFMQTALTMTPEKKAMNNAYLLWLIMDVLTSCSSLLSFGCKAKRIHV